MKKIGVLLVVLMGFVAAFAQNYSLEMEETDGVYRFPAVVNGARMKFVFDSGASCISLSRTMANYLLENNYVAATDFYGNDTSVVADGRRVAGEILYLDDVEVAGYHLKNVRASVIDGEDAALLFGQSGIQQLGKMVLNGNLLTFSGIAEGQRENERVLEDARRAMGEKNYAAAAKYWSEADVQKPLTDENCYYFAWSLAEIGDSARALRVAEKIREPRALSDNGKAFFSLLAELNLSQKNYEKALKMFQLAAEQFAFENEKSLAASYYSQMGFVCDENLKRPAEAAIYYTLALKNLAEQHRLSLDSLIERLQNGTVAQLDASSSDELYNLYLSYLFSLHKTKNLSVDRLTQLLCQMRKFNPSIEQLVKTNNLQCE